MPAVPLDLEVKQQGLDLLLPPYSYSIRHVASELDVGVSTVQKWRQELVKDGHQFSEEKHSETTHTPEQKFAAVIETAMMSEHELAQYCRQHGLYIEQIKQWKAISIQAHSDKHVSKHKQDVARRADKKTIKKLEQELQRKDKALAETAALLVLREKYNALWDNSEDD